MPSSKRRSTSATTSSSLAAKPIVADPSGEDRAQSAGSASKKKSLGSSRTGQACDRCKIRKIRCDAQPGGCTPCLQNKTECKTTDRITGRATRRGHTEDLEGQNILLTQYVNDLVQQLKEHSIEPRSMPPSQAGGEDMITIPYWSSSTLSESWAVMQGGNASLPPVAPMRTHGRASDVYLHTTLRSGCVGDNYLGISGNTWLSPIEGSCLSLFGAKIDFADFFPTDADNAGFVISYEEFLNYAFKNEPFDRPSFPPWAHAKALTDVFFRYVAFFVPVLHRPAFYDLIDRVYHEDYKPDHVEEVMLHVVFSITGFQNAVRNRDPKLRAGARAHFLYSLTLVPRLMQGHKLRDIQALSLLCIALRSLQRPGPAWQFVHMVFGLAIEMGLHRTVTTWANSFETFTKQEIEMRKRVFYSLLVLHINISGKLGRPMPLHACDIDVELPELLPDNLPDEVEGSDWDRCSYRAANEGFKLTEIMLKVYETIYAVRPDQDFKYEYNVRKLETELSEYEKNIPPGLRLGPHAKDADRLGALYLHLAMHSTNLLIHHPALMSEDCPPKVANDNLEMCLLATKKILEAAKSLSAHKALDTTIYYNMDFLSAIFVTLFAYYERRKVMTLQDLQQLRLEMDSWLEVMGEVGRMLGSGQRLSNALRKVIDNLLQSLHEAITARIVAEADISQPASPHQISTMRQSEQVAYRPSAAYGNAYAVPPSGQGIASPSNRHPYAATPGLQNIQPAAPQNPYPMAASQYAFGDHHPGPTASHYPPPGPHILNYPSNPPYGQPGMATELVPSGDMQRAQAAQRHPHQPQPLPPHYIPPYHVAPHPSFDASSPQQPIGGSQASWRNFTESMPHGFQPAHHGYAAELLTLGPRDPVEIGIAPPPDVGGDSSYAGVQLPPAVAEWPMTFYSGSEADGTGQPEDHI